MIEARQVTKLDADLFCLSRAGFFTGALAGHGITKKTAASLSTPSLLTWQER